MDKIYCLCGRVATHTAYLPMPSIYAGLKQVTEPHNVCDYHAEKARAAGYWVDAGIMEIGVRDKEEPRVPPRLFPKTYSDWVNLAEDIKQKDPDSAPIVNDRLNVICFEEGDVDAAKRWLVNKAGELGIR